MTQSLGENKLVMGRKQLFAKTFIFQLLLFVMCFAEYLTLRD